MDAVDVPAADLTIGSQRRKRQQRGVRPAVRKLRHGLRQILITLHDIQPLGVSWCLFPVPALRCVQISGLQGKTAKHRVDVGEETLLPLLFKARAQKLQRMPRVVRAAGCKLTAA